MSSAFYTEPPPTQEEPMNQFEKQLEKWNNGTLRGAQAKLARILKVSTATVALWTTGKRHPSKGYVEQMAQLFQISVQTLRTLLAGQEAVAYPENALQTPSHALRENLSEAAYSPRPHLAVQSNSIALPLLTAVPACNTVYEDSDVLEWWTLPRQRAQGAKFLFKLPGNGQIVAVKPGLTAPLFAQCLIEQPDGSYTLQDTKQVQEKALSAGADERQKIVGTVVFVLTENTIINKY